MADDDVTAGGSGDAASPDGSPDLASLLELSAEFQHALARVEWLAHKPELERLAGPQAAAAVTNAAQAMRSAVDLAREYGAISGAGRPRRRR